MKEKIVYTLKTKPVLTVATIAMIVTCFFVPPDKGYLDYFNYRTLATLFCTLAVVCAFAHIHVFEIISKAIVLKLHTLKNAVLGLVMITFFGSMLLANDMALLTFLPLGYYVLKTTDHEESMAFTFIMQNIAANLGGMVTPFGNPQNLYLYAYYQIPTVEFVQIMFPPFLLATILIILLCLVFVKPTPLSLKKDMGYELQKPRTVLYSVLFVFSLLIVFRIVPYLLGTVIVVLVLLIADRKALKEVNYQLLATFCVFFVFSGNAARIPAIHDLLSNLLPQNTLLYGILSCQVISNVPSAVLLSHFTTDYPSLLPAVNLGGLGTLVASLASLITFSEFKRHQLERLWYYMGLFSLINFGLLIILYFFEAFMIS